MNGVAANSLSRFPGLPPTTEFTTVCLLLSTTEYSSPPDQYLVRQGVRIRFREDRPADSAPGSEGRSRPSRKKTAAAASPDGDDVVTRYTPPPVPAQTNTYGDVQAKDESWSPQMIEAATNVWKNSPQRPLFGRPFGHEESGESQSR